MVLVVRHVAAISSDPWQPLSEASSKRSTEKLLQEARRGHRVEPLIALSSRPLASQAFRLLSLDILLRKFSFQILCYVGPQWVPEAGPEDELPRNPSLQVPPRLRVAGQEGEVLWPGDPRVQRPFLKKLSWGIARATRLNEFSPKWAIIYLRQLYKNYRSSQKFGSTFSLSINFVLSLTKNRLSYILGDFLTNSSGHPGPM
jgi:hypothetical protein